jgi:hypothetical protein
VCNVTTMPAAEVNPTVQLGSHLLAVDLEGQTKEQVANSSVNRGCQVKGPVRLTQVLSTAWSGP